MDEINTDRIENELLKNEMIARVEAYKTSSGMIKLEVEQKNSYLACDKSERQLLCG